MPDHNLDHCEVCPAGGTLREMLGGLAASHQAMLREIDQFGTRFRQDLRDQESRLMSQMDVKFGLKLAACEGLEERVDDHEDRVRSLEKESSAKTGAIRAHGRYMLAVWGLVTAAFGGTIGALAGHFIPAVAAVPPPVLPIPPIN